MPVRVALSRAPLSGLRRCGLPNRTATRSDGSRLAVPAGFNLGGPISAEPRINDRIRVPEVRLVGPDGQQVGIVAIQDALRLAQEADLDLVEIVPTGRPPALARWAWQQSSTRARPWRAATFCSRSISAGCPYR